MAKYPQNMIVGYQLSSSAVGAEVCVFPTQDTESGPKQGSIGWSFKRPQVFGCFEPFKLLVSRQLIGLTKTKEHNEKEASRYTYVVLNTKKLQQWWDQGKMKFLCYEVMCL